MMVLSLYVVGYWNDGNKSQLNEVEGNNCGNGYEYIEAAILINIKQRCLTQSAVVRQKVMGNVKSP